MLSIQVPSKIFHEIPNADADPFVPDSRNGYNANIHNQMLLRYKNSQHPSQKASTFIAF